MSETMRMNDEEFDRCAQALTAVDVPWVEFARFMEKEANRARASEDAKDKENERLKADNAAMVDALRDAALALSRAYMPNAAGRAMSVADAPHPGTAVMEELTRLRAQVATLIAGQQRNGEARQQAFRELAEELLAMPTAQHAAHLRRIIDNHENKP